MGSVVVGSARCRWVVLEGHVWGTVWVATSVVVWWFCWEWFGSEMGGGLLGGSGGEVEVVPSCWEGDVNGVLTIVMELCLNLIKFTLGGAVA